MQFVQVNKFKKTLDKAEKTCYIIKAVRRGKTSQGALQEALKKISENFKKVLDKAFRL